MATCPQPLPAPGVGSGLPLPLDEKTHVGNRNVSGAFVVWRRRLCLARVPSAGAVRWSSPSRTRGLRAELWAAAAPGVFVPRCSGLCPAGPEVQGWVASAPSSFEAADEPSARMKLEASVCGRNSFDVAAREF